MSYDQDFTQEFKVDPQLVQKTIRENPPQHSPQNMKDLLYFIRRVDDATGAECFAINPRLSLGADDIVDPTLSQKHCTFQVAKGILTVMDNDSLNGTYVAGKLIGPGEMVMLYPGDHLLMGRVEFEVFVDDKDYLKELKKLKKHQGKIQKKLDQEKISEAVKSKTNAKFVYKLPVAGAFSRIFALLADVVITYLVFSWIGKKALFVSLVGNVHSFLEPFYEPFMTQDLFKTVIIEVMIYFPSIFLFICLQVVAILLFKVSLGQFLLGIGSGKSFFWPRLGGLLRLFLGIFTAPFLIFDMPCLFNRRTFKEVLSFTRLGVAGKIRRFFGIILWVPLLILFAFLSPVLLDSFENINLVEKKWARPFVGEGLIQKFQSNAFQFTTQGVKEEVKFILLPFFQQNKNSNPELAIYQPQHSNQGRFKVLKYFNLRNLLSTLKKEDPFFAHSFPSISSFVEKGRVKDVKVFGNELRLVIENSFALNTASLKKQVMTYGPFVRPWVTFRHDFKAQADLTKITSMELLPLGDTRFLSFTENNSDRSILFPLDGTQGVFYQIQWHFGPQGRGEEETFYRYFFADAHWSLTRPNTSLFLFPHTTDDMSALTLLDYTRDPEMSVDGMKMLMQFAYDFYFKQALLAIKSDDQGLHRIVVESLESFLSTLDMNQADSMLQQFVQLKKALENRDLTYFVPPATEVPAVKE